MALHALQVANWFLSAIDREQGDSLTHLKLQKLVYYAQAWSLVYLNRPLFDQGIEAWSHGPVVREVWNIFKEFGQDAIPYPESFDFGMYAEEEIGILSLVHKKYGGLSGSMLRKMTHDETPWAEARGGVTEKMRSDVEISLTTMHNFYREQRMRETRLEEIFEEIEDRGVMAEFKAAGDEKLITWEDLKKELHLN